MYKQPTTVDFWDNSENIDYKPNAMFRTSDISRAKSQLIDAFQEAYQVHAFTSVPGTSNSVTIMLNKENVEGIGIYFDSASQLLDRIAMFSPLIRLESEIPSFIQILSVSDNYKLKETFAKLYPEWLDAVHGISSINEMCMHPAYQEIIGLGEEVLPLIFRELEKEPAPWFWALKAITRNDPVKPEERGIDSLMAKAWLEWAKENGVKW